MRNKIFTEQEALALGGGDLNFASLPSWTDIATIKDICVELVFLEDWLSHAYRRKCRIRVVNGLGLRSTALRVTDTDYVCLIPVGLIIRLDYLIRLLEREHGRERIHIVDPDFYGDLPEEIKQERDRLRPPPPLDAISDQAVDGERFWKVFEQMDADDGVLGRS